MTVRLLFTRRRHLGSFLIRHWQHSQFSHVALIDGCEVIEAVFPTGVRVVSLDAAVRASSYHEIHTVPCPNPELAVAMARSQVGKPYDWKAPLGVGMRVDWHDAQRWDCVELVAWAVGEGGRQLFRDEKHHRLRPHDLYLPRFA